MHKIPTAEEQKQMDLQRQAMIVNTRFQLSQTFLNTMLGRADVDIKSDEDLGNALQVSVNISDALMSALGIAGKE